ncbi:MAG: electron transfer flavoprotein subunit alpha/FixB family protein [Spirochaetota bacterium]|jgi:electron transfer flavoprotein alpha subunit
MSILVIADVKNHTVNPSTLEILSAANEIAKKNNMPMYILIPFGNIGGDSYCSNEFKTCILDLDIEQYRALNLVKYISTVIREVNASYIIGLHTPFSIDYIPALSVEINAQCVTQIHSLDVSEYITVTRGSHAGKLDQHIVINETPIILTILPGSFAPYTITDVQTKEITTIHIHEKDKHVYCKFITKDSKDTSLDEADVIVGAGKGIGSRENLNLIFEFAKLFPHSAVAGSRIVCDYGWLPYSKQIGITGKSIAPKVYIACAISGSSQHVAGIKGAKTIIAINKDPYAPIFNVSHYGVVADIFEFIPQFIDFVQNNT